MANEFHIRFCESFIRLNKKIYEETRLVLRYKETIIALKERASKINLIIEKYNIDEKNYKNRGVNIDMHDIIFDKQEELLHIETDIRYLNTRISTLCYNIDIYEGYIRCENEIHVYNLKD
jgi:hypothetical protein